MRISLKIVTALSIITGLYIVSIHLDRLKQIRVPFHGSLSEILSENDKSPPVLTGFATTTPIDSSTAADANIVTMQIPATTGSRPTKPTPPPLSETIHDVSEPTPATAEKEAQQAQETVEEIAEEVVEIVVTTYVNQPGADATEVAAADNVATGTSLAPLKETATNVAQQEKGKGITGGKTPAEQGSGQTSKTGNQQGDSGNKGIEEGAKEKQPQDGNGDKPGEKQQQQPPSQNPSTEQSQHVEGQAQAGTKQHPASPDEGNQQQSAQSQKEHADNSAFPEKMVVMGHLAREDVLWVALDLPGFV